MKICHISDTHGYHERLEIPACDVLAFTGDLGGRTTINELTAFLIWFNQQPANLKIFIAGNHDIVLDSKYAKEKQGQGKIDSIQAMIMQTHHDKAIEVIKAYPSVYLCNKQFVYDGVVFYGSPYSPSFHRSHWAFNADRGPEIAKVWGKIPSDVQVLLTHTPVYGQRDDLKECADEGEDVHAGCKDLAAVIKKRLHKLQLHLSGHIHDNYGVTLDSVSNTRSVLFSNGAVLDNKYNQLITKPLIIEI